MGLLGSIGEGIKSLMDRRKQDSDVMQQIKRDAELERQRVFEEHFRENSLEVAREKARREAFEESGLHRLRAIKRSQTLGDTENKNLFGKLSEYTQKNIARTEKRKQMTNQIRREAERLRKDKMVGKKVFKNQPFHSQFRRH